MIRPPLIALLLLAVVPAEDYLAKVVGITDGDTLTVLKADKVQVKVRLHCIDARETGQDFGSRAKQAASDLAFGRVVTIRPRDCPRPTR